ncbi:MAG TPA: hypothetical protein VGO62_04830, partial [Myxococcota bacterium]
LLGPIGDVSSEDAPAVALASLSLGVAAAQLAPFLHSAGKASERGYAGLLAALQLQTGAHGSSKGGIGPRAALHEILADIVRRHRGEVIKGKVDAIEADGKHITAVKATGANDYVARVVIDATTRRDIVTRLPEGRRRDKLVEAEQHVVRAGEATSVRWLVPIISLPRGMPPLALVLRANNSAVLVGVYAGAPLREGQKATGVDESLVAVVASSTAPANEIDDVLDRLLPFAKQHVKAQDTVKASAALPSYSVVESEHPLGGRRPQTPYANLLRAGRDLAPALGLDGEIITARAVASVAEHILGAHKNSDAA